MEDVLKYGKLDQELSSVFGYCFWMEESRKKTLNDLFIRCGADHVDLAWKKGVEMVYFASRVSGNTLQIIEYSHWHYDAN